MVDLETTGTCSDRHGILQISAVRFNLQTGEVDTNFFDQCLTLPPWRSWDEGTRRWWSQQKRSTLMDILARARDPREVINEFCTWAYPAGSMRMWAKPVHFDFTFVKSYCHDFDLIVPFHYRHVRDVNTFVEGLYYPYEPLDIAEIEFEGPHHNALFDTLHQIKFLLEAIKRRNQPKEISSNVIDVTPTGGPASADEAAGVQVGADGGAEAAG